MLFNSFEFVAFFTLFLILFFSLPHRFRGIFLLGASYVFYMAWKPVYALLLFLTTMVDYVTARLIVSAKDQTGRRIAMISALTINLGVLFALKYSGFFLGNVSGLASLFHLALPTIVPGFILPVGISFYTFQSIGYTLDVYTGRIPAERSLLTYAQYVSFFPQLVAGPIERAGHMLEQFKVRHYLSPAQVGSGLWLIGYGLLKKMCIADQVSPFVKLVFARPQSFNGSYALIAVLLFTIQIYCDFSGYSTIARGVARIFGYRLMVNFSQPYFSRSLTEFWRRWHVSLSSWFRDYLYFPLGGSRVSKLRWAFNTMIVFTVSGIWHGAAWTFIFWGAIHGLGLVVERWVTEHIAPIRVIRHRIGPLGGFLGWVWTISIVCVGWIFFRAADFGQALGVLNDLFHPGRLDYGTFKVAGLGSFELALIAVLTMTLLAVDSLIRWRQDVLQSFLRRPVLQAIAAVSLTYTVLMFGVFGHVDFIYFQF